MKKARYLTPEEERELANVDPVPLPQEHIDRLLRRIRNLPPRWKPWWKCRIAWLPILLSLALLAAAPIYWWWSA